MLVLNFIGEPGSGKSVTSAGVFYELSVLGYKVELVTEIAKGYAWESSINPINGETIPHPVFSQQILLLGEQNRLLQRLIGKRDIAIMECPLIMPAIYAPDDYHKHFTPLTLEQFNTYRNVNIFLHRNHSFDNQGRVHNESQSSIVKQKIIGFLSSYNIPHINLFTHPMIHKEVVSILKQKNFIK